MDELQVQDLMSRNVIFVAPGDDLSAVNELMAENGIRHIPVVNEEHRVLGLITHRDLLRKVLYTREDLPMSQVQDLLTSIKARDIMTREIETVAPDDNAAEAAMTLLENKFGCLPVTENETLVGILTEADFARHFIQQQSEEYTNATTRATL